MLAFTRATQLPNPVLTELFEILRQRDFQVDLGFASELLADPSHFKVVHDLYILKSHAQLWLSLAGIYHEQGALILNPFLSCIAVHDKIGAAYRLRAAGVPTPRTWVTGDLNMLSTLVSECPLIIKPYNGGRGDGIQIVKHPSELAAITPPLQPVLVQEYIPSQSEELKLYVIGDQVFGIHKRDSIRYPCKVSDTVRTIAQRCGQLFGLGLYGLDVLEGPDGPVVIDLNYFPSYKGVPEAAFLLADYIADYVRANCHEAVPGVDR